MTWKNHHIVTFATVFAVTLDIFASVFASAGSALPDKLEGPFWQKWHRKYTHWFVLYLPFLVFFWKTGIQQDRIFCWAMFWITVGALLHIAEDAVCGRVPFYSPTKKIYICPRLFYVGSVRETIFVILYIVGLVIIRAVLWQRAVG